MKCMSVHVGIRRDGDRLGSDWEDRLMSMVLLWLSIAECIVPYVGRLSAAEPLRERDGSSSLLTFLQ